MSLVRARLKNARISAQKARLVVDAIKGCNLQKALELLDFSNKKAAFLVKKLIESARSNAAHNHELDIDQLYIAEAYVDKSYSLKRLNARAKGRGDRLQRPYCHITVALAGGE